MKKTIVSFLLFLVAVSLSAKIELPVIFTNNMVLQQQSDAPIWGKASPNVKVEITTSWDKKKYTITVASDGQWKTTVKTPAAGGPYSISISDGKKVTLNNVMIGEVWICSGQSNMEMPLAGWGKVLNYEQEIASANYPNIRLLQVDKVPSTQPQADLKISTGGWQVCSPSTIAEFSSTAYFFGRNLNQNLNNIPIGLINTSWGGTIAEAWTSAETLENMPDFKQAVLDIKGIDNRAYQADYLKKLEEWKVKVATADQGIKNNVAVWAAPDFDDSSWKTLKLPGFWEQQGLDNYDGTVWLRHSVNITAEMAGKDLVLSLALVDDNDITYFNGQQIGSMDGYGTLRRYIVPGKLVKKGNAEITVRVTDTGGNGGINGEAKDMYLAVKSEEQAQTISLAGMWKYMPTVDFKKFPAPASPNNPNRPTVLYNAMIYPIVPYAIRGAIWYQGEANADRAYQYRELLPLMIRDWRKQWNSDFPFYFVQLANFMDVQPEPGESNWAELREAQLQTLHLENTGMAVIIDTGEAKDIHPKDKQSVGNRLALAARAKTYGQNIAYSGPIYRSYKLEEHKIRISFDCVNDGLKSKDNQPLKGFAIAGSDHKFYWADAVIEGNEIVVSSPKVPFPVTVRYAWADNPICNLYNGAGLPASPFRTDDWRH